VVVLEAHDAKKEAAQKVGMVGLLSLLPVRQGKPGSKAKYFPVEFSSRFED
jgi:hypothetical protein